MSAHHSTSDSGGGEGREEPRRADCWGAAATQPGRAWDWALGRGPRAVPVAAEPSASDWLSLLGSRHTPIPDACSRQRLRRAQRRHRRRLGFIYPNGRARPGTRNTEAFSCFLTAWFSPRTSRGRSIHVPGQRERKRSRPPGRRSCS